MFIYVDMDGHLRFWDWAVQPFCFHPADTVGTAPHFLANDNLKTSNYNIFAPLLRRYIFEAAPAVNFAYRNYISQPFLLQFSSDVLSASSVRFALC